MKLYGLTDSAVSTAGETLACIRCGSSARIASGLCISCMLQPALGGSGSDGAALATLLAGIDLSDADWRVGNYQILEEIGRGGMGVIYRARQRHSRRIVALKRVLSYHADSRETLARFRREAEAAASLDHPNILPIYEVGETEDGLPFFSMRLAVGGALLQVKPTLRNELREIVRLMSKVTRAVQYAHSQGILHRDLKPGNILLDGSGEPLVSDFGLAKWLDTSSDLTRTLTIFGTPGYIAPEQANGPAANLKPTADVYSIGAIVFDLIAGRPPFLGEHALAVIKQAAENPAPKLRSVVPNADRDLETICARCLEREPTARYQSAHDLATDLERWLEGRPIIARPVSPAVRIWRWSKRNPKLAMSGCVVAVLAAIAFATQFQRVGLSRVVRADAIAQHSVAVEPFLDLDTAQSDFKLPGAITNALQIELSKRGPAHVTTLSDESLPIGAAAYNGKTAKARTALRGTKRISNGKLRLSIRLEDTANRNVVYRQIIEVNTFSNPAPEVARLIATNIYSILDNAELSPIASSENDPGWRDQHSRELIIAGRALQEHRTLSDTDRAIDCFAKAAAVQPNSALAQSYLAMAQVGRTYWVDDAKYLSLAEISAKRAVELNPSIPETHNAASFVLYEVGHFQESLQELFTAYEFADSNSPPRTRVGTVLRMLGRPDLALPWYYRIARTVGRPAEGDFMIGDCWSDLVADDRAAAVYRRVTELRPELPEGWIGVCRLALLQGDFATARKISSENSMRYRDFTFAGEIAAQVEFFSRNFPAAEKLYRELASKDPNGGSTFYGAVSYQSALGRLSLAAHNEKEGNQLLNEALAKEHERLRSTPQHPEVLYRLAAIESSLGKVEPALQHLHAATEAGWIDYRSMALDPRFDVISNQPEFREIVTNLNATVEAMRKTATASVQ
jgi:tetratricopeptide (TPR) repeat protein/tRNA A-37 threonylcarbamoyl transferase component Bud32